MKLGYARVSTEDQNFDIQRGRLSQAGCEMMFEEKISGTARGRPELERLMAHLRKDDVLVVARLDRLARSTIDLLHIAERIKEKQAGLQSLDEPWADTTSPSGVMIMTVFAGIAQFERSLILKRTDEGRKAARARGVAFGRPKKMRPDQAELARQLVLDGKSISAIARTFNVHPATIYRCIEPNGSLMTLFCSAQPHDPHPGRARDRRRRPSGRSGQDARLLAQRRAARDQQRGAGRASLEWWPLGMCASYGRLNQHPLHLVQGHVVGPPIIELGGAGRTMVRHRRGRLQGAAVLQIGGDPGRAERMVADRRADLGRRRAPTHHRERIGLGQGGIA
jgi:DNA invertase Pin-like site-specific DNA recombinase